MKIRCPECHEPLAADQVNIQTGLGRCLLCDVGFHILPPIVRAPAEPTEVGLPDGMQVTAEGDRLRIERRWFSAKYIFLAFFALMWNLFLVGWYSIALGGSDMFNLIALLFPLGHVAAGVGLGYYSLAGLLNKTVISADAETLSVKHSPLKWRGEQTLYRAAIEQLYVQERVTKPGKSKRPVSQFEVHALLTGHRSRKLLTGLSKPEQAVFIAQQLEKTLGITDQPVPGEYQPTLEVLRRGERSARVGELSLSANAAAGQLSAPEEG